MSQPKVWTITWGERSWAETDALAEDLAAVQLQIGTGWDLEPTAGPIQLMAWIVALETRTAGRDMAEVINEVRQSPAEELARALSARDVPHLASA